MSNTDIWQKIVISELASRLNISRGSVYKWKWANKIPAERVVAITALPKVKLEAFAEEDIIQPGRGEGRELPMDSANWFRYAMAPASDATVDEMVELGRTHARLWADDHSHLQERAVADPTSV